MTGQRRGKLRSNLGRSNQNRRLRAIWPVLVVGGDRAALPAAGLHRSWPGRRSGGLKLAAKGQGASQGHGGLTRGFARCRGRAEGRARRRSAAERGRARRRRGSEGGSPSGWGREGSLGSCEACEGVRRVGERPRRRGIERRRSSPVTKKKFDATARRRGSLAAGWVRARSCAAAGFK